MQQQPDIIPLLLLKGRTSLRREYSKKELSALSKALRKKDYEKLYIMDLDGLERNKPQLDIVQSLCDDFAIFYEAGPRKGANIIDLIIAGSEVAYMNTASLESIAELEIALSFTEGVGFKIDWNGNMLGEGNGIKGSSVEKVLNEAHKAGIKEFVVPVEIIDAYFESLTDDSSKIRAIADRPGDEKFIDSRISSLIIDHKLLLRGASDK